MAFNFSTWGKSHQFIANKYLQEKNGGTRRFQLPTLPADILEWIRVARPKVEGIERSFIAAPFWIQIYQDPHNFKVIVGGRQIFKSTATTDFIAHQATAYPGTQVCYVTFDEPSLSSYSKQKVQVGTFLQNPILAQFPRHKIGNVHEISLKNNSTIYMTTDNHEYKHVEGKSLSLCILDEAQYQDIQFIGKVHQTMMATKGKLMVFGIGGESGSPYEKIWLSTNQMEWIYDDPNWRDNLQFDDKGLVIGEYLKKVLAGNWVPKNRDVTLYQGYHLPQTIFPTMPLTEEDAVKKYKIHPRFSIEFQKNDLSESLFCSHVLGTFYKSSRRPITREMVLACMEPYTEIPLMEPNEVAQHKNDQGDKIKIAMGVDFGSSPASSATAIAIMIWWRKSDTYQLAWIEKRPQENQMDQAEYITKLFQKYHCDIGVGDLGYGANQIKLIQEGGYSNVNGAYYQGVTSSKFFGCRTISDETKPIQFFEKKIDEHGDEVPRLQIDKTSCIESLIEVFEKSSSLVFNEDKMIRSKLIIPSKNSYEVDFLIDDLTSLTRKDLNQVEDYTIPDGRQRPRKEYNHPSDSVMALIYAIVGLQRDTRWHWLSVGD